MARTVLNSGTQTATINTEHTLEDDTANEGSVIDGKIDLGNMASGDTTTITLYEMPLASGTLRKTYQRTYSDVQAEPILIIKPVTEAKEYKLTLKQTAGTGRQYPWTLYKT